MAKTVSITSLLDALPANVAILDGQGQIIMVNRHWRAFATAKGLSDPDYAIGRDYLAVCDAVAADDGNAARVAGCLRAVLAGAEGPYQVTYPCAPPGEEAWYEATITRIEPGSRGRVMIQHVPATARVQTELARDRIAAEKNAAESEVMDRIRFLATASHDLRQPLQAVALQLAALKNRPHDAWTERVLDQIQTSLDGVAALLDRLLDFSRIEAGGVEARKTTFPVQRLLDQIAADFAPAAVARGLKFRVARCTAKTESDPILVGRILSNLVSNAVRYTARGGVVVGARRCGDLIGLRVYDTGIGVPEHELGRIFEEFYRSEAAEGGMQTGSGLGLAIVKRTAALLGHPVRAWSNPGHGSCFEVVLPRVDE